MIDGVDPALDPELALALRVSLEESRAAEEAAARSAQASEGHDEKGEEAGKSEPPAPPAVEEAQAMDIEDELLQQAIAISNEGGNAPVDDAPMDDEAALQLAIEMSMKEEEEAQMKNNEDEDMGAVLETLPGVDTSDPALKDALKEMEKE